MNYSKNNNVKNRKQVKSKKKKAKNKAGMIIFRVIVAIFLISVFAVGGAFMGAYLGIIKNSPELDPLKVEPGIYTSTIYDQNNNPIDTLEGEQNREYAQIEDIPQNLQDAYVAIEDERFYSHGGIDIKGIMRAIVTNLTSDRKEGASTITQQVIKNNVLHVSSNTITTKLREQYLAVEYERQLTEIYGSKKAAKDHILEVYLNTIYLNNNLYGVQTAAKYYFNKELSELTLSECAVIASITQNPTKYDPSINPENNKERATLVLNKMLELEMITQAEYDEAINDDVYARVVAVDELSEQNSYHSYFNDRLIQEVVEDLIKEGFASDETTAYNMVYNSGLQIYSTQDLSMQQIMDESFMNDEFFPSSEFEIEVQYYLSVKDSVTGEIQNYDETAIVQTQEEIEPYVASVKAEFVKPGDEIVAEKVIPVPQPQAAMVIMDYNNGWVKALTGGRGEKMTNMGLNRSTDSPRQPGSVFKVLASYAPAVDMGLISPATVYIDEPYEYPNGKPVNNWTGSYVGPVTVRTAIEDSMNIIAVKNMEATGVDNCFQYLLNFGFTTLVDEPTEINGGMYTDRNLATALGGLTYGVTQLELTAAYGAIANGGVYTEPVFYTKVLDHEGNVILESNPETRQVLKKPAAYLITDMMKGVITDGTGGKAAFKNSSMPISGKTGTATDTKDLAFAGYTPYYVSSIWMGHDHPKAMDEDRGFHMALWSNIMEQIHADLPVKDFERPNGVVDGSICGVSGKMAVPGLCDSDTNGNMVTSEIFMVGTQEDGYCNLHVKATIDKTTGMKAGHYCPPGDVTTVVGVVRDKEADAAGFTINQEWIDGQECTVHSEFNTKTIEQPEYYYDPSDGQLHPYPTDGSSIDTDTSYPSDSINPEDDPNPTSQPTKEPIPQPEPTPAESQWPESTPWPEAPQPDPNNGATEPTG